METKKVILKINGCRYDGFALEINYDNKTYSIGYCQNQQYEKLKTTKRDLMQFIGKLKENGFTILEKQWV